MNEELPEGWAMAPFELLFTNVTNSKLKLPQKEYIENGRYPVIDQGQGLIGGYTDIHELLHPNKPPFIIFGDHTRCLKYVDFEFVQGADGVKVLSPSNLIDPVYAYYLLKTVDLPDKGYSRHYKFLREISFRVAPLNEQKRIVAKIEELQSHSRRAKEALETIPDLLDQLRQSILSAAFKGDLTRKWREKNPDVEPATELLKRIRIERRKRWEAAELEKLKAKGLAGGKLDTQFAKRRKQYKEPESIDTTSLPELPDGWCWASLAELSYDRQYGSSAKSSKSGKVPVLRMGNLQDGEIDWSDLVYSSDDDEIAKYYLSPNTVLFNRTNSPELVGKTAIYRGEREAIFAGYLIRIKNLPLILPTYLNLILNSPFIKHYCSMVKSDAVNQSNINATKLGNFPIPLCSEMEQAFVVSLVEPILFEINRKTIFVAELSNRLNALNKSILSKAFCGELVPQDPNDEPASILLQRIREEAAQRAPKKKTRSRTTRKRSPMKKMDKANVLKVIGAMPQESFAFDELRAKLPGDYDTLKGILFGLLDDPQSGIIQVFDEQAKEMRFHWRAKS